MPQVCLLLALMGLIFYYLFEMIIYIIFFCIFQNLKHEGSAALFTVLLFFIIAMPEQFA